MDSLKQKAGLECLQNSQCSSGFECIENKCQNNSDVNIYKNIKLFNLAKKLRSGDSINRTRKYITANSLPYLLSNGEIVELKEGEKMLQNIFIHRICK